MPLFKKDKAAFVSVDRNIRNIKNAMFSYFITFKFSDIHNLIMENLFFLSLLATLTGVNNILFIMLIILYGLILLLIFRHTINLLFFLLFLLCGHFANLYIYS
ncbi:hypothetical protein A8C68_26375 [Escherichia coli]|nr:hypothetical protein A8C68_26375 [Escherichia coli]